ncbi:hypothetical protein [Streptomyces sp. CAS3]
MADVLLDHLRALPASTPAINQNSHRLFPGRRPSQPVNTGTLRDALRELGVPAEKAAPRPSAGSSSRPQAPVIAQALGDHDKSTTRVAAEAGAPWKLRTRPTAPDETMIVKPHQKRQQSDARQTLTHARAHRAHTVLPKPRWPQATPA